MTQPPGQADARSRLRSRTAAAHEAVDAAFGAFSLSEPASYARMLLAHAHALPPLEAALQGHTGLPAWRSRLGFLAADLAGLGQGMPQAADVGHDWSSPELHGLLYVLEGSRLGGRMLAREVPASLPSAFLAAGHEKGEWRALLGVLEQRAAALGDGWLDEAVRGALRGFDLYRGAAARFTR